MIQGVCPYPLSNCTRFTAGERRRKGNWLSGYCSQGWSKIQYQPVIYTSLDENRGEVPMTANTKQHSPNQGARGWSRLIPCPRDANKLRSTPGCSTAPRPPPPAIPIYLHPIHGNRPAVTADMSSPGFPRKITVPPMASGNKFLFDQLPSTPINLSRPGAAGLRARQTGPAFDTKSRTLLRQYTWPNYQKETPVSHSKFPLT